MAIGNHPGYIDAPTPHFSLDVKKQIMNIFRTVANWLARQWPLLIMLAIAVLALYGLIWKLQQ